MPLSFVLAVADARVWSREQVEVRDDCGLVDTSILNAVRPVIPFVFSVGILVHIATVVIDIADAVTISPCVAPDRERWRGWWLRHVSRLRAQRWVHCNVVVFDVVAAITFFWIIIHAGIAGILKIHWSTISARLQPI